MNPSRPLPPNGPLPAFVSRHFEDASFLWALRNRAVDSSHYTFADLELLDERVESHLDGPLWLCAESIGEVGAAASLCQLVRMAQAWQRGYAPGPRALCFASSVSGERAVAVVRRPRQPGEAGR
ncbi:hypothetical protein JQX13_13770 [Archangium violaceum]|uniref:hypothetical protein n=1 Tax=Archangium violaceum TaxID=83451 RepID=UPI00193B4830|nr:hypothetical protein [Archangium violaceum]QRK11038.1 hypothetical protein JQX13_13770 [Archangium violaceum]